MRHLHYELLRLVSRSGHHKAVARFIAFRATHHHLLSIYKNREMLARTNPSGDSHIKPLVSRLTRYFIGAGWC